MKGTSGERFHGRWYDLCLNLHERQVHAHTVDHISAFDTFGQYHLAQQTIQKPE
jgi:hypothetical protein